MARRGISKLEEQQMIAAAEAARDAGVVPERANLKVASDASAVLSVRLPVDELRALRAVAVDRGQSLSSLLQDAVLQLLTKPEPNVTATEQLQRFWVTGPAIRVPNYLSTVVVYLADAPPKASTGYLQAAAAG